MKQGMDINGLAQQVQMNGEMKRDYVIPIKNIDFGYKPLPNGDTCIEYYAGVEGHGGIGGSMNKHSLKQMTQELNIPAAFVDTLMSEDPSYLPDVMTRRAYKKDPETEKRMIRTIGNRMVAAVSPSFSRDYDNDIILKAVLPTIVNSGLELQSCNVDDTMMYLKMVDPNMTAVVRGSKQAEDTVQAGILCKNSDVGLSRALIAEFIKRLVCSNGMTSTKYNDAFRRIHRGSKLPNGFVPSVDTTTAFQEALAKEMRDIIIHLLSPEKFQKTVEVYEAATQRQLEAKNLDVAIKELGKLVNFTQTEGDDIMAHLIANGDLSQFGVMNAVTRYSQDVDNYNRASDLEQLGGKVLEINPRQWDRVVELQKAA